jgi:hypothetical protein
LNKENHRNNNDRNKDKRNVTSYSKIKFVGTKKEIKMKRQKTKNKKQKTKNKKQKTKNN